MDPDQTLHDLRALIATLLREEDEGRVLTDEECQFVDQVTALDQWLSRGGAVPRAWQGP